MQLVPPPGLLTFSYDALGRASSLITWTGVTLTTAYDCAGSKAWVSTGTASVLSCDESHVGTPAVPTSSSAITTTYSSNSLGQFTNQATTTNAGATNLLSFSFSYDDLGRITSSLPTLNTVAKATDNYGYDPTSRVTSGPITGTTGNPNYPYSPTGAITQATTHFATAAYAPNGQLCWTSATPTSSPSCSTVPTGATTFNYDLNGNRTSSTSPLSSTSLSWQSTSGRLVCVNTAGTTCSTSSPSATTTLYSYDAEGHRASSSNNGVTNSFIWDTGASQLLADSTHDYVYLQGSVSPDLQINLTTGTVDLLIQDQNANTRGVVQVVGTNSTFDGTIVNYTDFDAYGNAITQSGGSINPGGMANGGVSTDISTSFAFGAGYWDSSNLTYLVHRYLDNETGQFISVDPLVDQTREAYVYAGDEAISQLDVMGLTSIRWKGNSGDGAKALTAARTKLGAPYYYGFENSVPNRGNNLNDYLVCHSPTASAPYGIVKVTPVGSNSGTGNCTAARVKVGGKPGFDCSGLTQWSWSKIFPIGRDTRSQSHYTKSDNGKTVLALIPTVVRYSPGMTLTAGDLVFYGSTFSHVAMASTAGQVVQALCTGDTVRETTITYAGTPTYVRRMS